MGRKLKSIFGLVLVTLCAGALIGALVGASPAPGALPPPPGGGCGTGTVTGGATPAAVPSARPAVVCPPSPTPPPPGVTSTPGSTTTATATTPGTTTTPTSSGPVSTPVTSTVKGTTPAHPPRTRVPTTPVNVIPPPVTTPAAVTPPVSPAVITPPVITAVVGVAKKTHHKTVHHQRHHKHRKPAKHHKAAVLPAPPPPSTPAPAAKLPAAVQVTSSVPTPSQVKFKATAALAAVIVAGFVVLLLAFPAELFNKTYDENEEEIHLLFTRMGLRRHHLSRWVGLVVYALVGAGLAAWLALAEGSEGNPLAVAIGLLIALPIVTFAFELPAELYLRTRSKIPGSLRVLPTALIVGAVCAVISRAIHLEPAYLYGVFAGYAAARADAVAEEEEGKSVLVGVFAVAVVAGIAWFAWGALDGQAHGDHRGWVVIFASTAFFWIFVLAAESLVFGLIPLKYLDGSLVRRWRTVAWLVPQLAACAFFVYVIMLHGTTKHVSTFSELVRPIAVFLGVGLVSFVFWGYFQWKGRPTAGHGEEAAKEAPAPAPAQAPGPAPASVVVQPALLTAADLPGSPVLPTQAADPPK
jgi:hypothetical protein